MSLIKICKKIDNDQICLSIQTEHALLSQG